MEYRNDECFERKKGQKGMIVCAKEKQFAVLALYLVKLVKCRIQNSLTR